MSFRVFIFVLFLGCASSLTEKQYFLNIVKLNENSFYSKANFEVFKFEAKYPESKCLCDLWSLQISFYQKTDSFVSYQKKLLDKMASHNCTALKSLNLDQ